MKELLKEPSTWRGIVLLITGIFGLSLAESQVDILVNAAFILSGAIGAAVRDKPE
ncbi:hypothetical protein [Chromatium okenii]|jgi:hypothetical protein|uniref:hypothetical protein n=1 Tax=Chromatium okenii TaxID=61644 RepID=UPI0026EAF333|nr:hypothetical protein [Chromatium okenii]MBV5311536.1 hypothetical protein [Chromatium okenii]